MDPFDSTQATDADEEEVDFSTMTMGWRLPDRTTTATSTMSMTKTNSTTTATTSWTLRATSFRCKTAIPTTPCRGTRSSWGRLRRQDSEKTWLGGGRKRKNSRVSSEAQAHSEKERTNELCNATSRLHHGRACIPSKDTISISSDPRIGTIANFEVPC